MACVSPLESIRYETSDTDPAKSSVHGDASTAVKLSSKTLTWSVTLDLESDRSNFYYTFTRRLKSDEKTLREKNWTQTIPRDFQ